MKYRVTVREEHVFEVEVDAADPEAAIAAAEAMLVAEELEGKVREPDRIESNYEAWDWEEIEDAAPPGIRTIIFDENGPHDAGTLDVGQVHDVIADAINQRKIADKIDGYDRDDTGLSPDY